MNQWTNELKMNVLIILLDYENTLGSTPTLDDLNDNDLEFEKVTQHLLVMHGITRYNNYSIIPVESKIYDNWVRITGQPGFKREVREFWKNNPRTLDLELNIHEGTVLISHWLGKQLTKDRILALHDVFFPNEQAKTKTHTNTQFRL